MRRLPRPVRHVSVCSLQSVGTTQARLTGYTTDSCQITTDMPVRGWSREERRPESLFGRTVSWYAETTEQLYTSPSGYKAVWPHHVRWDLLLLMWIWKLNVAANILFSVWMCSYMAALEDTLNIAMCGLFLCNLAALVFIAFSAVTVNYFLTFWH
jgi:hypothetical protein